MADQTRKRMLLTHAALFIAYGSLGVFVTLLVGFTVAMNARQDLSIWHLVDLDEEFTTPSDVASFDEYLLLEDRLFTQLDKRVYAETGPVGNDVVNRYKRGSLSDPTRRPTNWNRSYELSVDKPRASVLLLHGLSDSPYSLRAIAQRLHAADAQVLGLRIPGHGTVPSGLVNTSWKDMAAAVKLAVQHLDARHPDTPLHIVGYSNGAALAVHYALTALDETELPAVDRLVLISPQIGVTKAAVLAIWQARLGSLLGMEKLAWNSIEPEYDPYKYGSFAINAGDVSYRITREIQSLLDKATRVGNLDELPPIQAFSSVVDATVSAPALIKGLLGRLPPGGNELVLFDINASVGMEHLYKWRPAEMVDALRRGGDQHYSLSLVSNAHDPGGAVTERRWIADGSAHTETALNLSWPDGVYSLSHVALPIPPQDPLYGGDPQGPDTELQLGDLAFRGERGVLQISSDAMLRLRWNPFYAYQERKILGFLDLE